MLIWVIFAAMTGAAVFALLWPLGRGPGVGFADASDARSLYHAQLVEIDRDLDRSLIGEPEAKAARTEAARRLLRNADHSENPAGETESSLRRRRASSALALSCVPLLALLVYGAQGSPQQPDQPLSARLTAGPSEQDFAMSLSRIEQHLAATPTDGRGWAVLAPVYLRLGRFDDAVRAFQGAIRNGGDGAEMRAGLGEAQVLAAGGVVTSEAREALDEALKRDPANVRSRYFLAVAREQDGDAAGAAQALRDLLTDAPKDASWAPAVRQRLEALGESDPGTIIANLPQGERQAMIRGMVESLAGRLTSEGGSADDWAKLVRSRVMLGERDAALAALGDARMALADDAGGLAALDAVAREFALTGPRP